MSSQTRQAFGRRVRLLRTERGLSLRGFALMTAVDKSHLLAIEHGRTAPTLDTIERIAGGLDVPMSYLLFEVDSRRVRCEYDGGGRAGGAGRR